MQRLEFDAVVEATERGGGGAFVRLPANAVELFGTKARFPAKARFNGIPYAGSTMPMGDGTSCIGILKSIREQAGVEVGDTVHVVVERDMSARVVEVPAELRRHAATFKKLSYTQQKEIARSIEGAKKPETRRRRIEQAIAKLKEA